ncbi:ring zinc finger [Pyrenophora seminiperda CCB06]|uniref:Ring zinc finger n=1 Tax=Pyrenophora seminiperda CCB06 TaxID=1302712 RepID=A0A3M7LVZ0_9PLEO|nr:ring zinc finger [Pyrenophora seminiperda CCB06]
MTRSTKAQASSARATTASTFGAFGGATPAFGASSSTLSYVSEPPDLSAISDPNVVVYFRNLSKKDSTTKAKALEDIQAYVSALHEPVEDGLLETWIKIYPRTSIDNAKAVRQNAHLAHGHFALSAGKRMAKHMPKSVAAWLCGLYDSDRSVVEATQASLRQVFNTPEKLQSIRKAYQQPILEYCKNAIDKETTATLSDERIVSKDDAEAKYSRVISACISLLGSLLANLQPEELSKYDADYKTLFSDKKLWNFASHSDSGIRRSTHRLLKTCLARNHVSIRDDIEIISKAYLADALKSDQTGSVIDYVEALTLLTTAYPSMWTTDYNSKTPVQRRLRQFFQKGSQFGPRDFWVHLTKLFNVLPKEVLPTQETDGVELLHALHNGITRKDEPKYNAGTAINAYLDMANLILQPLDDTKRTKLITEMILPILIQYLHPSLENSQWTVPVNVTTMLSKALRIEGMKAVLEEQWPIISKQLIDSIKTSAPEQSKDYEKSQAGVVQQATRFAIVQDQVLQIETLATLRPVLTDSCASIVSESLMVLKNRNGKPYGAAGALAAIIKRNPSLISSTQAEQDLAFFIQQDLKSLLLSPSSSYLIDLLYSKSDSPLFKDAWSASLKAVLQEPDSPERIRALEAILTSARIPSAFDLATSDPELQKHIITNVHEAVEGSAEWDSFSRMLQSPAKVLAPETTDDILAYMTDSLSISQQAPYSLQGLRHIVKSKPSMLREFLARPQGSALLQSLLLASESPSDEVAQAATAVNASIRTLLLSSSDSTHSMYGLIQQGLRDASSTSVSVETLVDLAKQSVKTGSDWNEISKVFPSLNDWNIALEPFLNVPPRSSLAITNALGGAVYLVKSAQPPQHAKNIPQDADGYSTAYRISQYVIRLFKTPELFRIDNVPHELRDACLRNIAVAIQLANDNLGLAGSNGFWSHYDTYVEADAMSFLSDAQAFVTQELKDLAITWGSNNADASLLTWADKLISDIDADATSVAYYNARTYSVLLTEAVEISGWKNAQTGQIQEMLKTTRKTKNTFQVLALINAFSEPLSESKACDRMCNEIIADLTGLDMEKEWPVVLHQIILLNSLLNQDSILESVAKLRLVNFVKHVAPWLQQDEVSLPVKAELCRALTVLLPLMSDTYSGDWSTILNALVAIWSSIKELEANESGMDSPIPLVHASLKLYAKLRTLTQDEETNDDLIEAWKEMEQPVAGGLINLLKHSQHFPDEFHQPLKMVNDVLARQISQVSLKHLESTEELFPLLYVESQPVQQTAFNILHKQIPVAQEQISIDAALEKNTARLPEELLSLIIEAPTVAALAEANLDRSVPLQLRGYLLSWLLVFDHLKHASFKVKNDYVEHIKEGEYLPGLLDFTFDFLGHMHNKAVDVSKLDITTYEADAEPPKRDLQWLLTHLYFLCLCHVPSLTKTWFKNCKSRALVVALEPWTEKHVSPPVIVAALESVNAWSEEQMTTEPDSPFTVKVANRAREITASYTVDDQTMSMRISLPAAFPLANAHIEGINRVAVSETKWQSWLRTSLGAITIFNGSLIDALTTFKRNVDGALKGQSECAICYSIVGSDRKLPDKKCGTCKNYFHGVCLFKWFKSTSTRVRALANRTNARLIFRPVLLGAIYRSTAAPQGAGGSASDVFNSAKKSVASASMARTLQRYKIPYSPPPQHPRKSVDALRLLYALDDGEQREKVTHAFFSAYWVEGLDVTDKKVLLEIAARCGVKGLSEAVFADEGARRELGVATEEAIQRGAFGVPGFWIPMEKEEGGGVFFWGQDRMHFVEATLMAMASAAGSGGTLKTRGWERLQDCKLMSLLPRCVSSNHIPDGTTVRLQFWYDFSSPWAFLGYSQLARLQRTFGPKLHVELKPVLLGILFREIGAPMLPRSVVSPAKAAWGRRDHADWVAWWNAVAAQEGERKKIAFHYNDKFPIRTPLALRVAIVEPDVVPLLFEACWELNKNVSDDAVLCSVLDQAGYDGTELIARANEAGPKAKLRALTAEAKNSGLCGVPTYRVLRQTGGSDWQAVGGLVWGQDEMNVVEDLIAGWDPDVDGGVAEVGEVKFEAQAGGRNSEAKL